MTGLADETGVGYGWATGESFKSTNRRSDRKHMTRTRTARTRTALILIASAAVMSAVLSACGGGSSSTVIPATSTTQSSGQSTSTTQVSASVEYLRLLAPVQLARTAFRASTTHAEAELRAGPFAVALENWSTRLAAFSWPSAAQSDVQKLIADIPPLVSDLQGVAAGDFADVSKAETDGAPVTADSESVRNDLGLPETG